VSDLWARLRASEAAAGPPTGAFHDIGDVMPDACTADRLWAHREAREEGAAAAVAGMTEEANPYPLGTVAGHGWDVGCRYGFRQAQLALF